MTNRRGFLKTVTAGTAVSAIGLASMQSIGWAAENLEKPLKKIRIGIIGAENSHTVNFGKLFNIEKKFEGVEVTHLWGENDEFAQKAALAGGIPSIVKDPQEMMGKIDALIVDHRHAKYHLSAATPFVKAGIPTFIDKPFCYRVEEGIEFLRMARKIGTPVTSYSSIANSYATFDMLDQLKTLDQVNHVVRYGPLDLDSEYGGVFFYGVHLLQPLLFLFGDEVEKVKITRENKKGNASIVFKNGLFATLIFKNVCYNWETFIETKQGIRELQSRIPDQNPGKMYSDIVQMFRTRIEPRSHLSILREISILEALEKSSVSQNWEAVKPIILD